MADLKDRVALVTGGAQGIGEAAARALAQAGAKVVIGDVNDASGAEVAREIGGAYVSLDVCQEKDWVNAVEVVQRDFGGLDILVNNAGIFWLKPITETSLEDFQRMQQVNVEGVFLGMKHAIPAIAARGSQWKGGGSIINISSVAGLIGSPMTAAYCASKGAVRLMSKSAAMECASLNLPVRVNSVHPGIIDTAMAQQGFEYTAAEDEEAARASLAVHHPLGRLGEASDVADAVLFLASDNAAFMTGSEVVVDGGMTAR